MAETEGAERMLSRRMVLGVFAGAGMVLAASAEAAEKVPFDRTAYEAAVAASRPILIEISAPWCPTCKRQKPIIGEILNDPRFADLVVLEVDFDTQGDIVRAFGAQRQATLIAYKGSVETARAVGITNRDDIYTLVESAL